MCEEKKFEFSLHKRLSRGGCLGYWSERVGIYNLHYNYQLIF